MVFARLKPSCEPRRAGEKNNLLSAEAHTGTFNVTDLRLGGSEVARVCGGWNDQTEFNHVLVRALYTT